MQSGFLLDRLRRLSLRYACLAAMVLGACSAVPPSNVKTNARVTPSTGVTRDLTQLPEPKARIPVAVYGFRDQTGQFRTDSAYSTLVTQGAATILVKALKDSGWYLPVEREGLQNVLTERRIIRAIESPTDKGRPVFNLPNLMPASMIIEGGVIGYESNVRTGGKGANYLGIGFSTQYRVDQVTVGLRSVDIRTGQVLNTASVTKTLFSYQFDTNLYKFVAYQRLLQSETGFTTNEPAQLAVREAIESAVIHLTVQSVRDRVLELKNDRDWNNSIFQAYLAEGVANLTEDGTIDHDDPIPMQRVTAENQALAVQPLLIEEAAAVVSKPAATPPRAPGTAQGAPVATAPVAVAPPTPPRTQAAPAPPQGSVAGSVQGQGTAPPTSPSPSPPAAGAAQVVRRPATPGAASKAGEPAVKQQSTSDDIFRQYWQGK